MFVVFRYEGADDLKLSLHRKIHEVKIHEVKKRGDFHKNVTGGVRLTLYGVSVNSDFGRGLHIR